MNEVVRPKSRMRAAPSDPWVSVSLLGESVFCDRAGRFQYEESQEDTGEESDIAPPRRGWYRPPFSVDEIKRELDLLRPRVRLRLGLMLTALAGTVILGVAGVVGIAVVSGLVTLISFVSWARATIALVALSDLLAEAERADTGEPDPRAQQPQPVNWWSLLRNGFQPQRYEDPLSDKDWQVVGKPWRVLQRGSVRIPVFRKRNEDDHLFRQHFARIAAYAHLIERAEGAEVPYGVILLGSSYRGLTVPLDPGSRKQFHDAVVKTRAIIKAGDAQSAPNNPNRCRACRWGKPMTSDQGRTYESPCGTRYDWVPPHQKAIAKGLR